MFLMKGSTLEEKTNLQRKDGMYELPELLEEMECPVCQEKGVQLNRTVYTLPDGDEILILLLECGKCGYRKTDTISMQNAFQPGEYRLFIDDADFTHKIFRGATGNIDIPEIGVQIERGPAATFDFTNVEGILEKIRTQVEFFLKSNPQESSEWLHANEAKKRILNVLSGKLAFTLILEDLDGGSYIKPNTQENFTFIAYKEKKKE